jgi:hypothetical protein
VSGKHPVTATPTYLPTYLPILLTRYCTYHYQCRVSKAGKVESVVLTHTTVPPGRWLRLHTSSGPAGSTRWMRGDILHMMPCLPPYPPSPPMNQCPPAGRQRSRSARMSSSSGVEDREQRASVGWRFC